MMAIKLLTPEQFEKEHEKELEAFHRALAFELSETIINNAPVDTGKLKGSINVSILKNDIVIDDPDPSGQLTKTRIRENLNKAKIDNNLYGSVGEYYAPYVDGGTSKMAPTGFFTLAINSLSNIAKRASNRIKEFKK